MAVSAKVASAYIDLVARTEAFQKAMDDAVGVTRKCNAQMRAEMQESKASIVMLGEAIGIHIPWHLQTVINKLPGVSAAMNAAFAAGPILLAIKIVFEAGEKVMEFAKKNEEAARKNIEAWHGVEQPLLATNDQIRIANDKLENAIAKMEHKPENGIKLAIDEAIASADTLGSKLYADNLKISQLLESQQQNMWNPLNWGNASEKDITGRSRSYGEDQDKIDLEGRAALAVLRKQNATEAQIAATVRDIEEKKRKRAEEEQKWAADELDKANKVQASAGGSNLIGRLDQTKRIPALMHYANAVGSQADFIGNTEDHEDLSARSAKLNAAKEAASEAKSAAAKQMEEWRQHLTAMQDIHVMSLDQDADYWKKLADNPRNSAPARASALAEANKMQAEAVKQAQKLMFEGWISDDADLKRQKTESERITEAITAAWDKPQKEDADFIKRLKKGAREVFEQTAAEIEATEKIAEAAIRLQEAHGQISKSAGAIALMQLHDKSNDQFQSALGEAQNNGAGVGLKEIDRHKQEYGIQAIVDAQAVLDTTWKGMIDGVYEEVAKKADETQSHIKEAALRTIDSMNSELAKGMTGHKMNFSQIFDNASQSLAKTGLEKAEGSGLQMLASTDFGKKLGLGDIGVGKMGSKTNPMWVKMVEGAGAGVGSAAGSIFASLFSKDSSSAAGGKAVGGVLGGLGSLLTHFATGGDVMAGVPFRGGELGEEAFVASVPGRVIPHNQLGGNTWHIDARGADPALTQANFIRGLQMARAGGAADAMHGISERQRRTAQ